MKVKGVVNAMDRTDRRKFMLAAVAVGIPVAGCDSETVSDVVTDVTAEVETETLADGMVALRGFEIVAWEIGKRVIWLPVPAVRIIGVSLIITAGAAKLAITYLDVELKRREAVETLLDEEVVDLESSQSVTFKLDNGYSEEFSLGPSKYE